MRITRHKSLIKYGQNKVNKASKEMRNCKRISNGKNEEEGTSASNETNVPLHKNNERNTRGKYLLDQKAVMAEDRTQDNSSESDSISNKSDQDHIKITGDANTIAVDTSYDTRCMEGADETVENDNSISSNARCNLSLPYEDNQPILHARPIEMAVESIINTSMHNENNLRIGKQSEVLDRNIHAQASSNSDESHAAATRKQYDMIDGDQNCTSLFDENRSDDKSSSIDDEPETIKSFDNAIVEENDYIEEIENNTMADITESVESKIITSDDSQKSCKSILKRKVGLNYGSGQSTPKEVTFADDIASYRFYEPNPDEYGRAPKRSKYTFEIGDIKFHFRRKKKPEHKKYRFNSGKLTIINTETKTQKVFIPKTEKQRQVIKMIDMLQQRKDSRIQKLNVAQAAFRNQCMLSESEGMSEIPQCTDMELFECSDEVESKSLLAILQDAMDEDEDDKSSIIESEVEGVNLEPINMHRNELIEDYDVEKNTFDITPSSGFALSYTKHTVPIDHNVREDITYVRNKDNSSYEITYDSLSHSQALSSTNNKEIINNVEIFPVTTNINDMVSNLQLIPHVTSITPMNTKPLFTSSFGLKDTVKYPKENSSNIVEGQKQLQLDGVPHIITVSRQQESISLSSSTSEENIATYSAQTPANKSSKCKNRNQSSTKEPVFKVPFPVHNNVGRNNCHENGMLENNNSLTRMKSQVCIAEPTFQADVRNQYTGTLVTSQSNTYYLTPSQSLSSFTTIANHLTPTENKSNYTVMFKAHTMSQAKSANTTIIQQTLTTTNKCNELSSLKSSEQYKNRIKLQNRDSVVYSASPIECIESNNLSTPRSELADKTTLSGIVSKETVLYPLNRGYAQSTCFTIGRQNPQKTILCASDHKSKSHVSDYSINKYKKTASDPRELINETNCKSKESIEAKETMQHFEEIARKNAKLFGENDWQINNVQKKMISNANCDLKEGTTNVSNIEESKSNGQNNDKVCTNTSIASPDSLVCKSDADTCQVVSRTMSKQDMISQVNDILTKDRNMKLINDLLNEASSNMDKTDNLNLNVKCDPESPETNTTKINSPISDNAINNGLSKATVDIDKFKSNMITGNETLNKHDKPGLSNMCSFKDKPVNNNVIGNSTITINNVNRNNIIDEYVQCESINNGSYLAELHRIEDCDELSVETPSSAIDLSLTKESTVIGRNDDLALLTPTIYSGPLMAETLPNVSHSLINLEDSTSDAKELGENKISQIQSIKPVENVDWHGEWQIVNKLLLNYISKAAGLEVKVNDLKSQVVTLEEEVKGKAENVKNLERKLGENGLLLEQDKVKYEKTLKEKDTHIENLKQRLKSLEQKETSQNCRKCSDLQTCMKSPEIIKFIDILNDTKQRSSSLEMNDPQPSCSYVAESSPMKRRNELLLEAVNKPKKPRMEVAPLSESQTFSVENKNSKVDIVPGSGVYVNKTELCTIKLKARDSATMMMRFMLELFFTTEKLASCSAAGRGHAKRPALDGNITTALITYIKEQFPGTTDVDMMQAINQKCTDSRKIIRRRNRESNE